MKTTIIWNSGLPTINGKYLVVIKNKNETFVTTKEWNNETKWETEENIIYWKLLKNIEPFELF